MVSSRLLVQISTHNIPCTLCINSKDTFAVSTHRAKETAENTTTDINYAPSIYSQVTDTTATPFKHLEAPSEADAERYSIRLQHHTASLDHPFM